MYLINIEYLTSILLKLNGKFIQRDVFKVGIIYGDIECFGALCILLFEMLSC